MKGAVTVASLPKYQPLMVTLISLVSRTISSYNIDVSGINNIDAANLMKPYLITKPVQRQILF